MIFCSSINTFSNDRKFGYTYQSMVLGMGNKEIEIWTTARVGKDIPFYSAIDNRFEFEVGLSERLQTAFYLNFRKVNSDDGTGMTEHFNFEGISTEWKYQFTKPGKDPLGFAVYEEIGLNTDEIETESKLIFDKRISRHTFALNLVLENEWKLSSGKSENETAFEGDFGWCYDISNSFSAGIEVRNHNVISGGEWKNSALFAGPVLSYSQPSWWVTLNIMPQIAGLKGKTGNTNLVLDEHERLEARMMFSFRI